MKADSRALERSESPAAVPGVLSKVFSFPVMLAGLLTTLAVLTVRERFDDPDMWWHLKLGETTWTTHHVPMTDLFSYTTNHHSYIPHEWLSQLMLYAAYHFGGYSGMMLWLCFFTSAVIVGGYALCWLYSGNAKVSLLGALIIFLFGTVGFSIRPQMIGYLLLIVELGLLHLGRTRNQKWFWGLPPLFALWVNCHGSFSLGIAVATVYLISSYCHFQAGLLTALPWNAGSRKILWMALLLSIAALFLNPVGLKLVLYPLQIMLGSPINLGAVDEWKPLQLDSQRGIGFMAVVGGIVLATIVQRSLLYFHEILLLILTIVQAGSHERLVFVFGIVAAPILCRILSTSWAGYSLKQDHPWANALLLGMSLLIAVLAFPNRQDLVAQVDQHSPVGAVEYINSQHLPGPMLNDYVFGGYLIWASPEHPVFVDGRTDIFEWTGVLDEYGRWATLRSNPSDLLERHKIGFCLLSRQSPMIFVLKLLPNWKIVYSDSTAIVLIRTHPSA